MKKIALLLLASATLLATSCKKTGPQGPQGPQGNANVKGSDKFDVSPVTWAFSTPENAWEVSFTDQDITQAVADHGVVEQFLLYSDGTWRNLPDILDDVQFYSRFSAGGFDIYCGAVNGGNVSKPSVTYTFRTVVIAPGFKQAHPNTNWKDYATVQQVFAQDQQTATATASHL